MAGQLQAVSRLHKYSSVVFRFIPICLMMRLMSLFFALLFFLAAFAQKKEIRQARSDIKKKTNLDKAETSMRNLLKDSSNIYNVKIYVTLADAVRAQYEAENEKLYLKAQADTAKFFNTARRMFHAYESLDSIDMMPDKKGRVKLDYRKKNAEYLNKYRSNLYNGGIYFARKASYDAAYGMFDTYIDTRRQPLFSDYAAYNVDSLYAKPAFWAIFCAYKENRADSVFKYSDLALQDKKYRNRTFMYLSEAYLLEKDTAKYVETLRKGFGENMTSKFFFGRLMDYYNGKNRLDSAKSVVDAALMCDSDNGLFLFAKSNLLLNMGRYQECIEISDALIARNDTIADVYLNAGVSYINMALALEADAKSKKKNRKKILDYYKKALPYMEKYREMAPDKKENWAQSLYNIYLRLNMGSKFEEVSDILKKMRQ